MILGILDDDREFARSTAENLEPEALISEEPGEVYEWIREDRIDGLFTDLYLNETTGIEVLERILELRPGFPVVVMTGYGSIDSAVEAMKQGARDYLEKPLNMDRVRLVCERMEEDLEQRRRLEAYRRNDPGGERLVGSSSVMDSLREEIDRYASEPVNVLITGETGTGKETIAHRLHEQSARSEAPFITVNCAALSGTTIESNLFGHVPGAFPGAESARKGFIELADGGSLLLDDLNELDPSLQAKLLRVLEEGEVTKLGTDHPRRVDVRFLATAAQPADGDESTIRSDLYYRLNVARIEAPPLRDHPEDIPELIEYFRPRMGLDPKPFTDEALELLKQHPWPGNVRELRNVLERTDLISDSDQLGAGNLPSEIVDRPGSLDREQPLVWSRYGDSLPEALKRIEREIIQQTLEKTDGNQSEAARRLGVSRQNLHYKLSRRDDQDSPSGDASP